MAQPLFPSSLTCWHSEPTSSVFRIHDHAQWKEITGCCQDQHSPVKSLDDKQRCFKNKTYIKININSGYGSRKWEVTEVKASQDFLTSTCQSSQTYVHFTAEERGLSVLQPSEGPVYLCFFYMPRGQPRVKGR